MLAELTVGDPGVALFVGLEREGVDEGRAAVDKLDVAGIGVFEGHPVRQGDLLDVERSEGRILELREAPLERVADELDAPGPDDSVGTVVEGEFEIGFVMPDEQAAVGEAPIEPGSHQQVVG